MNNEHYMLLPNHLLVCIFVNAAQSEKFIYVNQEEEVTARSGSLVLRANTSQSAYTVINSEVQVEPPSHTCYEGILLCIFLPPLRNKHGYFSVTSLPEPVDRKTDSSTGKYCLVAMAVNLMQKSCLS